MDGKDNQATTEEKFIAQLAKETPRRATGLIVAIILGVIFLVAAGIVAASYRFGANSTPDSSEPTSEVTSVDATDAAAKAKYQEVKTSTKNLGEAFEAGAQIYDEQIAKLSDDAAKADYRIAKIAFAAYYNRGQEAVDYAADLDENSLTDTQKHKLYSALANAYSSLGDEDTAAQYRTKMLATDPNFSTGKGG